MKMILLAWIALLLPVIAERDDMEDDLPPRPADGIFDPDQWLEKDAIEKVTKDITRAREKGNASVFVAVFSGVPRGDIERYAAHLGKEWAPEGLWGLVCHVPGDDSYPRFFGGFDRSPEWSEQQLVNFQDSIQRALADIAERIDSQDNGGLQVENGVQLMADDFGYLGLVMERIDQSRARVKIGRISSKSESKRGWLSPIFVIVVPVGLLSVVAIYFLLKKKPEEESDDYFFPKTQPRRRFGAPWSGGGNVVIRFDSPKEEDDSRKEV